MSPSIVLFEWNSKLFCLLNFCKGIVPILNKLFLLALWNLIELTCEVFVVRIVSKERISECNVLCNLVEVIDQVVFVLLDFWIVHDLFPVFLEHLEDIFFLLATSSPFRLQSHKLDFVFDWHLCYLIQLNKTNYHLKLSSVY